MTESGGGRRKVVDYVWWFRVKRVTLRLLKPNQQNLEMRQLLTILFFLLALVGRAQQQISYIEETKNWYYVYDEKGKIIGGLSRSSVGEIKGWGSDFFVAKRYSFYYICDAKGRTLKTMNVSDVGEIVAVTSSTITSRRGDWILTWSKEGKKISARTAKSS